MLAYGEPKSLVHVAPIGCFDPRFLSAYYFVGVGRDARALVEKQCKDCCTQQTLEFFVRLTHAYAGVL